VSRRAESLAVATGLTILAVILTWPAVAHLGSAAPDLGDPLLTTWILAWDVHALATAPLRFFDANMFYPYRGTLAYTEHLLGLVPLVLPARLAGLDPLLAHNLLWLATFPLVGLTLFWLVRELTGHAGAATVAAVLYAFSHLRFGQLGHIQVLAHMWLPLALFALHRAATQGARWRDVWLAAGALGLQALSSGYQACLAASAAVLFAVWLAAPAGRPPLGRFLRRALLAGGVVGVLLVPAFLPYWWVRTDVHLVRDRAEVVAHSAWPTSYLVAAPANRWLSAATAHLRSPEGALLPGVVTLALALPTAVLAWRRRRGLEAPGLPASRRARAADLILALLVTVTLVNWLVVGGVSVRLGPLRISQRRFDWAFLVLAAAFLARRLVLGPRVPVYGLGWLRALAWPRVHGYYLGLAVVGMLASFGPSLELAPGLVLSPLYDRLPRLIPGFDMLRVPARFGLLVSLGLTVLAGLGAASLARHLRSPRLRGPVLAGLGLLGAIEAWAVPIPYLGLPPAGPAQRALAQLPGSEAAVILPMYASSVGHLESLRLLESTAHWRPLVNGYASAVPSGYQETIAVLNTFPAAAAVARLRALHVRYVVVHLAPEPRAAQARLAEIADALPSGVTRVATFPLAAIFEVGGAPPRP
jgi:hypothetical protein